MFSFFAGKRPLLGLDIGASSVKAVQLNRSGREYELIHLGMAPLSPEAIVDGVIMDGSSVISAIQQIYQEHAIKTRDVAVAVSGNSVIVKKIKVQQMTEEELTGSIQWEAEQYIPFPIEDVNLDFQILEPRGGAEMDVLLVAVKKDVMNDYLTVISSAGLNGQVVDVDALALENAYEISGDITPDRIVALVNLGATVMNINILQRGVTEFTRDAGIGGNRYTESIQKMLGLSFEQADKLKMGTAVEGRTLAEAQPAIDLVNAELAGEIRRSMDFFRSSSQNDSIHKVVLSGGGARLPGLVGYLGQHLEVPVEVANPLRAIKADPKKFDPEYLEFVGPQMGVAVGLALRQVDDK